MIEISKEIQKQTTKQSHYSVNNLKLKIKIKTNCIKCLCKRQIKIYQRKNKIEIYFTFALNCMCFAFALTFICAAFTLKHFYLPFAQTF